MAGFGYIRLDCSHDFLFLVETASVVGHGVRKRTRTSFSNVSHQLRIHAWLKELISMMLYHD